MCRFLANAVGRPLFWCLTTLLWLVSVHATAGAERVSRLQVLEQQYEDLRSRTDTELARLAQAIDALREEAGFDVLATDSDAVAEVPEGEASRALAVVPSDNSKRSPVSASGDFRIRYEHTSDPLSHGADRDRGVLRGRLAAEYRPAERWAVGARLVTGDPDDPNSTDVTLGNFTDNFAVSLDLAYLSWAGDHSAFSVGKFANPLARTDLVWDGDVNPQGVTGRWRLVDTGRFTADFTGLFALIDEQAAGPNSELAGGQFSFGLDGGAGWSARLHAGYYDYHIGSLANADSGDVRGNRLDASGADYLSEFELLNLLAVVTVHPAGGRWPVTVKADYVRNFGAADGEDTGYSGAVSVGRLAAPGDLRFGYGYSMAETDAVFAAYSHNNITYSTNYRLHALSVDYVLTPSMRLNLTGYRYRRNESMLGVDDDPINRIRLNWNLKF